MWSESEDCLPFLQLAQDYISSCGKKTLLEVLEKVFTSFRPVRNQKSDALGSHSFVFNKHSAVTSAFCVCYVADTFCSLCCGQNMSNSTQNEDILILPGLSANYTKAEQDITMIQGSILVYLTKRSSFIFIKAKFEELIYTD